MDFGKCALVGTDGTVMVDKLLLIHGSQLLRRLIADFPHEDMTTIIVEKSVEDLIEFVGFIESGGNFEIVKKDKLRSLTAIGKDFDVTSLVNRYEWPMQAPFIEDLNFLISWVARNHCIDISVVGTKLEKIIFIEVDSEMQVIPTSRGQEENMMLANIVDNSSVVGSKSRRRTGTEANKNMATGNHSVINNPNLGITVKLKTAADMGLKPPPSVSVYSTDSNSNMLLNADSNNGKQEIEFLYLLDQNIMQDGNSNNYNVNIITASEVFNNNNDMTAMCGNMTPASSSDMDSQNMNLSEYLTFTGKQVNVMYASSSVSDQQQQNTNISPKVVNEKVKKPAKRWASKNKDKKVYTCLECSKTYTLRGNLRRHHEFECGKSPQFQCKFCDATFFYENYLMCHLKSRHSKDKKPSKKELTTHNIPTSLASTNMADTDTCVNDTTGSSIIDISTNFIDTSTLIAVKNEPEEMGQINFESVDIKQEDGMFLDLYS